MLKEYFNWKKSRSVGAKAVKRLRAVVNGVSRKARGVLVMAIAMLMAVSLAACGNGGSGDASTTVPESQPPAAAPASAKAEEPSGDAGAPDSGDIVVYTALEDEQVTEYLDVFNSHFPDIKVNIVRDSTGIITAKLLAEKDNPQADLVWGTAASSMMVLDSEDMLEGYAPAGVDRILPQFKSGKSEPTWVGIDAWETAIVVNTVEFAKTGAGPISSYEDLLQPELKDCIVMSNPASSGTGLLTVAGVLQLKGKDTDAGWDFLDQLNENVAMYVHSGSKPAKMAGAGETTIGISFGYAGIKQIRDGAPVEVIFPAEGSGWDLESNALMKKDGIKAASKTFLDWAISDEAMDLYKANYPIIATGQGGKYEGFDGDPVDQLIDNDFVWVSGNRDSILDQWTERYDGKSEPK
ncbi:MAG: putative 2-aminoethylphosphonate ABC transporter substrate-binding protein [Clostridiales bacterium]|nr:putative 2-aminoethylphosphonate ABC transporter substrate-binding protein [Clostridiales bacterium]